VIPPTQIVCIGQWVIIRSRVTVSDIVDLITSILGKWTLNLAFHSQMVNRTTYFT